MGKTVFTDRDLKMTRRRCAAAAVALILVVAGTSVATAAQTDDPFVANRKAASGPVPDSTSTSATKNRPIGLAHEQMLNDLNEHKLATTLVESMSYPEIPFSEVVLDFQNQYQIQLLVDNTAQDDQLDHETIISFRVSDVPLERALELLLREHNATFLVRSGVVHVISKDVEDDQEFFETRIFDCDALTGVLPPNIPDLKPVPTADDKQSPAVDTRTTLEKLVQENVNLDSWMYSGNGDAIVREINGKLLVRNSGESLRETRRFLEFLNSKFVPQE